MNQTVGRNVTDESQHTSKKPFAGWNPQVPPCPAGELPAYNNTRRPFFLDRHGPYLPGECLPVTLPVQSHCAHTRLPGVL
ncbi:hypothetical protein EMIT043CA1_140138 [Pseudomonas brassicacearum]